MSKRVIHTNKAPAAIGAYSQGIVSEGHLFTSGQIGLIPETGELVRWARSTNRTGLC